MWPVPVEKVVEHAYERGFPDQEGAPIEVAAPVDDHSNGSVDDRELGGRGGRGPHRDAGLDLLVDQASRRRAEQAGRRVDHASVDPAGGGLELG